MVKIVTDRLTLRPARMRDLQDFHAVLSDQRAMRYWATPPHRQLHETATWLSAMIASPPELSCDFVIEHRGAAVGKVGAWRLPEFGYILAPHLWGQGLASEALAAFLDHAFTRPTIDHLVADVDPRNTASLRLLDRHGFRETHRAQRTIKTHLGWCDSVYLRRDRR